MADRVSRKEIATEWGTSTQYVDKLVKEGRLQVGADKKIDKAQADRLRATLNPNNVAKEAEAKELGGQSLEQQKPDLPITKARIAHAIYAAKHKELVVKRMAGELMPRNEVKVASFEAGRAVQQTLRAWPPRLSGEITALRGLPEREFQRAVRVVLEREIRRIVSDLTISLESLSAADKSAA